MGCFAGRIEFATLRAEPPDRQQRRDLLGGLIHEYDAACISEPASPEALQKPCKPNLFPSLWRGP